jgi:hypothetical protein
MSQNNPAFRMSLLTTSVAFALISVGCGGAADTTAALTEAAYAGTDATTLTLDETSRRRRASERPRATTSTTDSSAMTVPTTTTSAPTTITSSPTVPITTTSSTPAPTSTTSTTSTTSNTSAIDQPLIDSLPLLTANDLTYEGAFRYPNSDFGGRAITPYKNPETGKLTLFINGSDQQRSDGQVAQIEVPRTLAISNNINDLPIAATVQPFSDVSDGELSKRPNSLGNATNGSPIYGMLAYENKLIVASTFYYDYIQNASHGVSSLILSNKNDFNGFYSFRSIDGSFLAPPRALGGQMSKLPTEWQAGLGGIAITGNQSVPVMSTTSFGPAITIFDPSDVGTKNPIPGKTLLFYSQERPLCGTWQCESTTNNYFNGTTEIVGHAAVSGTRTILFIGKHGVGTYWYGNAEGGPNGLKAPCPNGVGPYSDKYEYRVYAYDTKDLVKVKNGALKPWEVMPYAIFPLKEINAVNATSNYCENIKSATFDQDSRTLFISHWMSRGELRIETYSVK